MWLHASGRPGRKADYYACHGRSRRTCDAPMVRATTVEDVALSILQSLTIPEAWFSTILNEAAELITEVATPPARTSRADIERGIKRLGRLYVDGIVDDRDYQRQRDYLQAQLAQCEAEQPPPALFDLQASAALLRDMPQLIDVATFGERRLILRTILQKV